MIRIDLGQGAEQKSTSTNSVSKELQGIATKVRLPPAVLDYLSDARQIAMIGVGAALAMLPHLFFSQYRGYVATQHAKQIQKLKENMDAVSAEIVKYSPFEKELESYEQQKKLVNERLNGVRELLNTRNTPVSVLDAVGQSIPQKAWLTGLSFDFKPDQTQVVFQGTAYSNEDISDFVDKLSESIYLQEVRLNEVTPARNGQLNLKHFSMLAIPKARFPGMVARKDKDSGRPTAPAGVPNAAPKSFFKKKG